MRVRRWAAGCGEDGREGVCVGKFSAAWKWERGHGYGLDLGSGERTGRSVKGAVKVEIRSARSCVSRTEGALAGAVRDLAQAVRRSLWGRGEGGTRL